MDPWEIFRGFFGLRNPRLEDYRRNTDDNQNGNRENDEIPPGFVGAPMFGMLGQMEKMFNEMEQSMRDIDSFFQEMDGGRDVFSQFGIFDSFGAREIDDNDKLPLLPPPSQNKNDENVRSLVLKDDSPTANQKNKIDNDLDHLFGNSLLHLEDLPPPPPTRNETQIQTKDSQQQPGFPQFERVYSTHTFRNGLWEGKTVKETGEGKAITTYQRNANGEVAETTEFVPNDASLNQSEHNNGKVDIINPRMFKPLQFLESLFKPRL